MTIASALTAPVAFADGAATGPTSVTVGSSLVDGISFGGTCQDEFAAAGVGSGGASYEIQAEGTAVGTKVLDTQVQCWADQDGVQKAFIQDQFTPGDAGATAGSFSTTSLDPVSLCMDINAFISNGATVNSGVFCPAAL